MTDPGFETELETSSVETELLTSEEVERAFRADHDINQGSNDYALSLIRLAASETEAGWTKKELSKDEILRIVLPPHNHSANTAVLPLIPSGGLPIALVLARLKDPYKLHWYSKMNPVCMERLRSAASDMRPVFLSRLPVDEFDYNRLQDFGDKRLFHLDGLHRLIGRGLVDDYRGKYLADNPVIAYIAKN